MSNKRGFTLIEVIVSITIIVAIVGTGAMLVKSYSSSMMSNQSTLVASGLARDLLNQSYESRRKNPEGPISVTFDRIITLNNIEYVRDLSIDTVDDSSQRSNKYWQATAKITWNNNGRTKEIIMKTDIAKLSP